MPLYYVTGNITRPIGEGSKVIAHICNDLGQWDRSFVTALSRQWKRPERAYHRWYLDGEYKIQSTRNVSTLVSIPFRLGETQIVYLEPGLFVANMLAEHKKHTFQKLPLQHDILEECLTRLYYEAHDLHASVHMPRLGAELPNGKWRDIEPIVRRALVQPGVDVYVYDH